MRTSRPGVSTVVGGVALIVIITVGVFSAYYAYTQRETQGHGGSGFTYTLTRTPPGPQVPEGDSLIVVPLDINFNPTLTMQPLYLRVVLGVNSTILFYNNDTTEHIIESIKWPSDSGPFQFFLLPGRTVTVKLNVTGIYQYNFELQPAAKNGTITVLAP